jgi:hypothetical protein
LPISRRFFLFIAHSYNEFSIGANREAVGNRCGRRFHQKLPHTAAGGSQMALSFAKDIRPLFRDTPDIDTMRSLGIDLSSYLVVQTKALRILQTLEDGFMPCDDPWPPERIELFKNWIKEGMAP